MRKKGVNVIGFGAGEPDFDTPRNIKDAAIRAIKSGFTKYTPASGTPELKESICKKFEDDNGLSYETGQIIVSCGAKHSLYSIFQALCDKSDEVIVISPYWVSYTEMIRLAGAEPRIVNADEKDRFEVDPEKIKKIINKQTKALIINSPANPTGAVLKGKVLREIADIAVSKKINVISDEIYEKLIYDEEEHVSIGSLGKDILSLTVTVNGVSKSYSMTGWRIGYLAGNPEIVNKISALQSHSTSNPASISQAAALEALKGDQAELLEMKKEFVSRRNYMVDRINKIEKMSCVKPKGAFYVFCNISGTGLDSVRFCERLLEEAHVACVPGCAFGLDTHVRLSFATGMENIKTGLDRIEDWIGKL